MRRPPGIDVLSVKLSDARVGRNEKGMSASQTSPACKVIVKPLVLGGVAGQEGIMTADRLVTAGRLDGDDPAPGTDGLKECRREREFFAGLKLDLVRKMFKRL